MVTLTKIYTRGGDRGLTSLGDGSRVAKYHLRVTAYGTVDEANATIGIARLHTDGLVDQMLARVQNDLFDLGADLCRPTRESDENQGLRVSDSQVERLESEIDRINGDLQPLNSFVLPGGSPASAQIHLARTVTRRAERFVCELADREVVNEAAIKYLNRLSDLLFVLARYANAQGQADVLWTPGAHR